MKGASLHEPACNFESHPLHSIGLTTLSESFKNAGLGRAVLHAAAGCAGSLAASGSCKQGAISAGLTKFLGANNPAQGSVARFVSYAVIGGTAAELSGGKFANGAQTAAFQYLFNEAMTAGQIRTGLSIGSRGLSLVPHPAARVAGMLVGVCSASDQCIHEVGNILNQDHADEQNPKQDSHGQRPSKTPNTGEPGSVHVNPGSGQERKYGNDGKPEYDIDYDHDHGQGVPHAHNWENGKRGSGVPISPIQKP